MSRLAEEITHQWLEGVNGRTGPFLSDLQNIILAVVDGELDALRRENARLAGKLERLERKVKRMDPEGVGSHLMDGCG